MITYIYETHLQVSQLDQSIHFFEKLGLQLAHKIKERRVAFFFVGPNKQMLGIWEVPEGQTVQKSHFSFGVSHQDIEKAILWLKSIGSKEPIEPIVHTWMPAACVYFLDPDGNSLELLTLLDDTPIITDDFPYLSEWNKRKS
ncbi:VOC family protein [Hazenella sp. IB182357]|uniref:VOC family protein n=1 Tax=Polycladospora coralii TaxID=2771432 RepID=A0A926NGD4_9BACL|nr:VOC family protein [Polycladospora coralii]